MTPLFLRSAKDGLVLAVQVQPRAAKNEIAGPVGDRLKVRLTAPPVEGKANKALVKFLAKQLGLPASGLTIVAGHKSRQKDLLISGLDAAQVVELLSASK